MTPGVRAPADVDHLWFRLRLLEGRVRRAVEARDVGRVTGADPGPEDPFLGLYLTPGAAQRILDTPGGTADPARCAPPAVEPPPAGTRLAAVADRFGLAPVDVELLLVAVAPEVDTRFERLYGYLNDDMTRRRPTVGLALELCELPAGGPGLFRFAASAPLVAGGVVDLTDPDQPMLSRGVRLPDRVVAFLLGDDVPDGRLRGLLTPAPEIPEPEPGRADLVAGAVAAGPVYLRDTAGDAARLALEALWVAGRRPLVVDVAALADHPDPLGVVATLVTEARLAGAGIVLGPLDRLDPRRPARTRLLRELVAGGAGLPLILHGATTWDPTWSARSPLTVTVPPPDPDRRTGQWRLALSALVPPPEPDRLTGLAEVAAGYRLDADQVRRVVSVAGRLAGLEGRTVTEADLRTAVRAQNGAGLERLARRVTPAIGRDDLVVPSSTGRQLDELVLRARHRDLVLGRWRMRPGGGRGRGVTALFAGGSGTGKTMSAEVVAAELGVDLYVVDLSTVVDKYVGETEKNLERIFTEAAGINGVLLFDEADAIFGKRSQVKDSHDRYANVESAYLLQRMESFDGVAVLTTNLRANLDEAFTRRLDVIAEFPLPDADQRLALWDRCLGPHLSRDPDLDLEFCATRFKLAGGSIRACAVTAAYLAAETGRPVTTGQVIAAIRQEYRKLGHLLLDSEFAP
jgi:hypothetical protein